MARRTDAPAPGRHAREERTLRHASLPGTATANHRALDFGGFRPNNEVMARVVIEHLTKEFNGPNGHRVCALQDVSLVAEAGEFLVVVGPSGCGKTTTLRIIAGLEEPTSGTVRIDDAVVNRIAPKDRDVAMVFQNGALYPHMTVFENMVFGLKARKCPGAEADRRVREAVEALGLADCLERKPEALSGGQRQRVALGRALVRRPKVFLFDEPLANLDAPMRLQMRAEISRLHARLAATMIYVTHDQVEAMALGDRIVVMRDGVIQQVAEPMTLYRQPANLFVAGFIGSPPMNFFRGTIAAAAGALLFQKRNGDGPASAGLALRLAEPTAGKLDGYRGKEIVLGIRPEDIADHRRAGEAPPGRKVEAVAEVVEPMGAETYLHLKGGGQAFVARAPAGECVEANQKVSVVFDMDRAHFFDPATGRAIG